MKKWSGFVLALFIGVAPALAQKYSTAGSQTFLFQGEPEIRLSIETYKEYQGWKPCLLLFGDLAIDLEIGPSGGVYELQSGKDNLAEPLFTINLVSGVIILPGTSSSAGKGQAGLAAITVTECNSMRTRILVPGNGLAATLTLEEDRERAELSLFGGSLRLPAMYMDTTPVTAAQSEIQLYGPSVSSPCLLIHDRLGNAIYFKNRSGGDEHRPQALGIRVK